MSKFAGMIIEQDPKCDTRFRITLPEDAIDKTDLFEGVGLYADYFNSIKGASDFVRITKDAIKKRASAIIWDTEMCRWIKDYGGRKTVCRYAAKQKGDRMRTVFLKKGQPAPQIINDHFRVGLSVTFRDRDKAMLFKMQWMNAPLALAA
jgi:hypothetical protein